MWAMINGRRRPDQYEKAISPPVLNVSRKCLLRNGSSCHEGKVARFVLNALAGNTASPLDIRAFGDCVPSSSEKTLRHEQKRSAEKIFTSRR
jgi:hypothetical protein